jgi:ABC-type multidrug transport system permease subunit
MLPLACCGELAAAASAGVPLIALLMLACAAVLPNADGIALVAWLMVLLPARAAGEALVALLMLVRRDCCDAASVAGWQLLSSVPLSS